MKKDSSESFMVFSGHSPPCDPELPEKDDCGSQSQFFENRIDGSGTKATEWLNTKEAARYLRTSPGMLRKLISQGRIPYYKFGRSNRYKRDELRKLLEAEKRGGFRGN